MAAFAWAAAAPAGSSPDEDAHVSYAWGTVTGQVFPWNAVESVEDDRWHMVEVEVPTSLLERPIVACYRFQPSVPACPDRVSDEIDGDTTTLHSHMARYPWGYYAPVGAVLWFANAAGLSGESTLLVTRTFSGLLGWGIVALSGAVLARRFGSAAAVCAVAIAVTPMSLFLMSSVNPNGFEIATAVATASAVVAIRHDVHSHGRAGTPIQAFLVVVSLLLGLARPASVVWLGLMIVLLLVPLGKPRRSVLSGLDKKWIAALLAV